jgi:hypothetical protein
LQGINILPLKLPLPQAKSTLSQPMLKKKINIFYFINNMERIEQNSNRKTLTALAGILFFSYFIKKSPYYLNSNTEDRIFFDHYLKIGKINLIFLIGDLLFLGMNFFIDNIFVEYGTKILSFLILVLSFFASLFAIG